MNEYLLQEYEVKAEDYFTVMGPCHAEEVAAEKLSYLTFSGKDTDIAKQIASNFTTEYIYTVINNDVTGVQFAAILKIFMPWVQELHMVLNTAIIFSAY